MQIRAAVLEQFGAPLVVREVDLAEPRAGEVLVRLVACGVCHTDLYTASGADPSGYAPTVLGHEGAGVVLRRSERGAEVGRVHRLLRERQQNLAVLLEQPASVHDREPDEAAVGPVPGVVTLGRRVETDGRGRFADVEVQHVGVAVVHDPVELDAGDSHAPGSFTCMCAVAIHPSPPS